MKKKLLSFLSLILVIIFCFGLTGCSTMQTLSFKNSFVGDVSTSEVPPYMTEKLTYEINYVENYYTDYISKSKNVTDDVVKFEFGKGTFVQTLEILDRLPLDNVSTDITGNKIYHLKSEMTIPVKYACNGEDLSSVQENIDTVVNEVYFLASDLSFAPIYSKTETNNTYLNLFSYTSSETANIKIKSETIYNKANYTMKVDITSTNMVNGEPNTEVIHTNKTYNYEFRKLIDNTQLLFAIRNTKLTSDSVYATLPTVSPSYGSKMDISVQLHNQLTENFNITYTDKGATAVETGEITYNHISFIVGSTTNTGASQYLKVQNAKSTNLPYRALVLEYAETLTSYGTPACLGALVYTLKSVEIN